MYHGFSDPSANPLMTIDYYQSVIDLDEEQSAEHATAEVNEFLRLYMAPAWVIAVAVCPAATTWTSSRL